MKCNYKMHMAKVRIDSADREKCEETVRQTWEELRNALATKNLLEDDIDRALTFTFFKVFDDFFTTYSNELEKTLEDLASNHFIVRGTILDSSNAVGSERFITKAEYIKKENRFSPAGIEWLYLATATQRLDAIKCSEKECRANKGQHFGICDFYVDDSYKDKKIIDLTVADKFSYKEIDMILAKAYVDREKEALQYQRAITRIIKPKADIFRQKIERWTFYIYLKLLSEQLFVPIEIINDPYLTYAPFHCIANYFFQKGYVGIKYKSTVSEVGENIVLFNKFMAKPDETPQVILI